RGLPEYTTDDDFAASGGSQLVLLPGSNPPTYRARYEKGFVRYRWHQAPDGREGYWTAEYPDGSVGYFGADSDGNVVSSARVGQDEGTFRYMLVEKVDVYDHKIRYTYQKSGEVALLRNIGYVFTQGDNNPSRYSVSFQYQPREDETGFDYLSDAKGGFNELLTQRLSAINVFSGSERIRRYELSYERYADSGGFTRLSQVQMLGLDGTPYPVTHSFSYSQALGGICEEACGEPFVVEMGNIGVNVGVGRATLLDINGDSLPDLLNTSSDGAHTFILNEATTEGKSRFAADTPVTSAVPEATGSGFRLGTPYVHVLDSNGDGFTDLIHAQTGRILLNRGNGDWEQMGSTATGELPGLFDVDFDVDEGELRTIRFLDYDNDKRIDLLRSTRTETSVYRNHGSEGFLEDETIDLLGYGIQTDKIQFTDMNGDGLLDPVKLSIGGLRYRLNLGWGQWGDEIEVLGLPIEESELELASLEDLNGDGLSDLVIVVGQTVKMAINRNGTRFSGISTFTSNQVDGAIPQRDATTTVLYADMNGNGSSDVVWLAADGAATYLELFPVRPNQLARIENGLGSVTDITYGTSVQHMAQDGGWEAWEYRLPHPMLVVDSIDRYDLLTNVHEVTRYQYHDGFYDGIEKQFRGYARVE
ncbi:MAG: toxin TcdB middle/N-terminal domain-containing protein, partial [Myxococcota bacterium]